MIGVTKQVVSMWIGMGFLVGSVMATQNLSTEVVNEHHGLARRQYTTSLVNAWGADAQLNKCAAMSIKISTDSAYRCTLNTTNCAVINCRVATGSTSFINVTLTYDPCYKRAVATILGTSTTTNITASYYSYSSYLYYLSQNVMITLDGFTTTAFAPGVGIVSYNARFYHSSTYVTGWVTLGANINTTASCMPYSGTSSGSSSSDFPLIPVIASTAVFFIILIVIIRCVRAKRIKKRNELNQKSNAVAPPRSVVVESNAMSPENRAPSVVYQAQSPPSQPQTQVVYQVQSPPPQQQPQVVYQVQSPPPQPQPQMMYQVHSPPSQQQPQVMYQVQSHPPPQQPQMMYQVQSVPPQQPQMMYQVQSPLPQQPQMMYQVQPTPPPQQPQVMYQVQSPPPPQQQPQMMYQMQSQPPQQRMSYYPPGHVVMHSREPSSQAPNQEMYYGSNQGQPQSPPMHQQQVAQDATGYELNAPTAPGADDGGANSTEYSATSAGETGTTAHQPAPMDRHTSLIVQGNGGGMVLPDTGLIKKS